MALVAFFFQEFLDVLLSGNRDGLPVKGQNDLSILRGNSKLSDPVGRN